MATSFGVGTDGQPHPWAIPIMPNGQPSAAMIADAALILGLAAVSLRPHTIDGGTAS